MGSEGTYGGWGWWGRMSIQVGVTGRAGKQKWGADVMNIGNKGKNPEKSGTGTCQVLVPPFSFL